MHLGDGLGKTALVFIEPAEIGAQDRRTGIDIERGLQFIFGLGETAGGHQELPIPVMGVHVIGLEGDCLAKLGFGVGSVPLVIKIGERERGVCLSQRGIERKSLFGRRPSLAARIIGIGPAVLAHEVVGGGKLGVGRGVFGIDGHRVAEALDGLFKTELGALRREVEPFEISIVSFVFARPVFGMGERRDVKRERMADRVCHAGLKLELVAEIALEDVCPHPRLIVDPHQLRGHANVCALLLQAAFDEVLHVEFVADLLRRLAGIGVGLRGGGSDDPQLARRQTTEPGNQLLRNSVANVAPGGVAGHIGEGQHGDGDGVGVSGAPADQENSCAGQRKAGQQNGGGGITENLPGRDRRRLRGLSPTPPTPATNRNP